MKPSPRGEVAQTAAILAASKFVAGAAASLLPILVVRRLTQSEFGAYKQIDLVAGLLLPFLGLGLDKSLTYFVPRNRERADEYVTAAFLPCGIAGALCVLLALLMPSAGAAVLGTEPNRLLLVSAATTAVASVFVLSAVRALIATGGKGTAGVITAARGPVLVLLVGSVMLLGGGLHDLLWCYFSLAALQIATSLGVLRRAGLLARHFRPELAARQFRFGAPLWGSALIAVWADRMDRYLVSLTLGPAAFAVYAVGRTSVPFYTTAGTSLETAMAPNLARWESEGEYRRMADLWSGSIRRLLPVAIMVFIAMQATADWVIPFLYTGTYRDAVPIVRVSAFALLFSGFTGTDAVLRAFARTRFLFATNVANVILRLGLGVLALREGSLVHLAVVALGTDAAVKITQASVAARCLSLGPAALLPARHLAGPIALAGAGAAASLALERFVPSLPARFAATAVVWGAVLSYQVHRSGMMKSIGMRLPWKRRGPAA